MITFNTPYRNNDEYFYANVNYWLGALYANQIAHKNQNFSIESLNLLQEKIGYHFKDISLLITALTHKSFFHENKTLINECNERLEFLGDSFVNLIVTKVIFKNFPELNEGEMSKLRTTLVNEDAFSKLAIELKLQDNILIGKGEYQKEGYLRPSVLADAFEAIFGAMSLEMNQNQLEEIFFKVVASYEQNNQILYINLNNVEEFDSKSRLQEIVMAKYATAPIYLSKELNEGFEVELLINGKSLGKMAGISKKKLEKELAKHAILNNLI